MSIASANSHYYKPSGSYKKDPEIARLIKKIPRVVNREGRPTMERKFITNTILQYAYTIYCINQIRNHDVNEVSREIMNKAKDISLLSVLETYNQCWTGSGKSKMYIKDNKKFKKALEAAIGNYNCYTTEEELVEEEPSNRDRSFNGIISKLKEISKSRGYYK